ncbi:MAG TPA: hypothetical protein VEW07_06000 [Solirubrobacterales bacterium]|nr:hypothetical protein [Solirubrobacterales bacterium]
MRTQGAGSGLTLLAVVGLACLALLAPSGASAATVVNGDFESGELTGWSVSRATTLGDWYAYKGTNPPIGGKALTAPVFAPPQGTFAAITDEYNPDTLVLYQDVALRPGYEHRLSLFAYYTSLEPLAVPTPDTLSVDEQVLAGRKNQQYRIDVMRPEAPIESLNPGDILRTVFRTQSGDPKEKAPAGFAADLSAFAGQTVRLRIAVAATEETLNAGVDAVAVASAPPGQLPPLGPGFFKGAGKLSFGKVKLNRTNGSAILPVDVPGPGRLSAKAEGPVPVAAKAGASKAKKLRKLIKPVSLKVTTAGTVKLRLQPTDAARGILELKQKLRVKVVVTYTPAAGSAATETVPVVLKLEAGQRRQR